MKIRKTVFSVFLAIVLTIALNISAFAMPKATLDAAIAQANTELIAEYKAMIKNEALNRAYPVGAIYITYANVTAATVGNAIGGTWTQLPDYRFLYANGGTIGTTGGANSVTLAVGNLPSHAHSAPSHRHGLAGKQDCSKDGSAHYRYAGAGDSKVTTSVNQTVGATTGGGGSHTTVPPYVTVKAFRRTG